MKHWSDGGIRKRLGIRPRARAADKKATAGVGKVIKAYFGKGRLNARESGELAGAADPSHRLAKAKGRGTNARKASKNSARTMMRALKPDCVLHPTYLAKIPQWDKKRLCSVERDVAFLPVHETLDAIVQAGEEESYTAFSADQHEFKTLMQDMFARLSLTMSSAFAALGLWCDSAPFL